MLGGCSIGGSPAPSRGDSEIPPPSTHLNLPGEAGTEGTPRGAPKVLEPSPGPRTRGVRASVAGPSSRGGSVCRGGGTSEDGETRPGDPIRGKSQAGSLTGAVHLSNANAGVLRLAQAGQKPAQEQKGKSQLDLDFQYEYRRRKPGLSILLSNASPEFGPRGVRKVTTGITGLWRPSVHSDVAF